MKLKHNQYWFRPKLYGYGFRPISWEGWLATLVLLILLYISAYINDIVSGVTFLEDGLRFLLDVIIITSIAALYFKPKTKGKLRWRWGN